MSIAIGVIWGMAALVALTALEALGLNAVTVPVALLVLVWALISVVGASFRRIEDGEDEA